jgi:hypothetical protein
MGITYTLEPKEGLTLGFLLKSTEPKKSCEELEAQQSKLNALSDERLFELTLDIYDSPPLLNLERMSDELLLESLKKSEQKFTNAETAGKLAEMSKLIYAKQSGIFLLELKARCQGSFGKTLSDAGVGKTQCEIKMRIAKRWHELIPLAVEAINQGEATLSLNWADRVLRKKSIKSSEFSESDSEKLETKLLSRATNYLSQKPEIIEKLPDESIAHIAIAIGRRYQNISLIDFGTSLLSTKSEPNSERA